MFNMKCIVPIFVKLDNNCLNGSKQTVSHIEISDVSTKLFGTPDIIMALHCEN